MATGDLILTPVGRLDRFGTVLALLAATIVVLFVAEESFRALLVAVSLEGMVLVVAVIVSNLGRAREPGHRRRHRSAPDGVEDRQDDAPAGRPDRGG